MGRIITVLQASRVRKGLTQQAVADACQVSKSYIASLESGARMSGPGAERIAAFFGFEGPEMLWEPVIIPRKLPRRAVRTYKTEQRRMGREGAVHSG